MESEIFNCFLLAHDFHLDKDTEAVFEHFQNRVGLVKEDKNQYKGVFCIDLKDVDDADKDELKRSLKRRFATCATNLWATFYTKCMGIKF